MSAGKGVPEIKAELTQAVEQLREALKANAPIKEACETAGSQLGAVSSGTRRTEAREAISRLGMASRGAETVANQVQAAIEEIETYSNSL